MGWQVTFDGTKREISDAERAAELAADPFKSIWEGGTVVDLDDLPPDVYDRIARDEGDPDVNWWVVYTAPGGQASRFYKVICAAAAVAGVAPPASPSTMRESRVLLSQVERTQDPTGASETETLSSTGLSAVSDGSPQPSGESDSPTS